MFLEYPPLAPKRKQAETQKWRSNVSSVLSRGINPKAKSVRQHFCDTKFIGPPGFEPGTPIKSPISRIDVCSIGTSHLPIAPKPVRYENRVIRVLLRIGGELITRNSVSLQSLLGGFAEFFASWRFYVGVLCSVPVAIWLHERFGDETWVWFVSIPLVLLGTVGGFIWQLKNDK
jgi:hypothetical protein